MDLHAGTLFIAAALNAAVISGLLLLSWVQDRQTRALLWWSAAFLSVGIGFALFTVGGERAATLPREIANAVFAMSYGASYSAARRFNGRSASWLAVFGGATVWLAAVWLTPIGFDGRVALSSALVGCYASATAYELWRGERLLFQRAAAVVSAIQGGFFLLRAVRAFRAAIGIDVYVDVPGGESIANLWAAIIGIETLLYISVFGFIIMAMAKERVDLANRRAALIDPLTGAANRRGFMQDAARLLTRSARRDEPVSMLVFDLDNFKSINDRFGHQAGDDTLVAFCDVVRCELPMASLFGRTGGEEFAVLVPDMAYDRATELANRIREQFEHHSRTFAKNGAPATVSAGVAAGSGALDSLLSTADAALYQAKAAGRNRVVVAGDSSERIVVPAQRVAG